MSGSLGALTMAWIEAEAARPLEWRLSGVFRFGDLWVALSEGPEFDDYSYGTGQYAEQALRRLAEALSRKRQVAPSG
ncbi:MAG: hypothetical protein ABI864_06135 [Chloroflexota bacterium]